MFSLKVFLWKHIEIKKSQGENGWIKGELKSRAIRYQGKMFLRGYLFTVLTRYKRNAGTWEKLRVQGVFAYSESRSINKLGCQVSNSTNSPINSKLISLFFTINNTKTYDINPHLTSRPGLFKLFAYKEFSLIWQFANIERALYWADNI